MRWEPAEKFFRHEFFNRIDRVLTFDPLGEETIRNIARREIGKLLLREGITRRQLLVEIEPEVVDQLAVAGFHPRYGARPLHREIERGVIRPLARLIVEQQPGPGDLIRLAQAESGVAVSVQRIREPGPTPTRPRPAEKPRDASLARAAATAESLWEELHTEQKSSAALAVSGELSNLLERINSPGFWDEPDSSRRILTRVYQLQRVSDRLVHVGRRIEGLVEFAHQLRAGAAAGGDEPAAELAFHPIGAEAAEWAEELAAIYTSWAERTGKEVIRVTGAVPRLTLIGPGSYALLAHEAGLHRRELPSHRRLLARVTVSPRDNPDISSGNSDEPAAVVRVYSDGARTGVRDPRTGVREGNLQAVLEGKIDEFILASAALVTLVTR